MECKKCTYFESKKNVIHSGAVIVGYCKLRQKHISDTTIGKELCKDKAVVDADQSKMKKQEDIRLSDINKLPNTRKESC